MQLCFFKRIASNKVPWIKLQAKRSWFFLQSLCHGHPFCYLSVSHTSSGKREKSATHTSYGRRVDRFTKRRIHWNWSMSWWTVYLLYRWNAHVFTYEAPGRNIFYLEMRYDEIMYALCPSLPRVLPHMFDHFCRLVHHLANRKQLEVEAIVESHISWHAPYGQHGWVFKMSPTHGWLSPNPSEAFHWTLLFLKFYSMLWEYLSFKPQADIL